MHNRINSKNTILETINIKVFDLKNYKLEEDEISINGKLYDIQSIAIYNDRITLKLLHDNKEEWLLEMIKHFIHSDKKNKNKNTIQLTQLLTLLYLPIENAISFAPPIFDRTQFFHLLQGFLNHNIPILLPPPKI